MPERWSLQESFFLARRDALDGLRGIAALNVTFYHGILHYDTGLVERALYRPLPAVSWQDLPAKLLLIVFNGETSVIAFFVLSGFVLGQSLMRQEQLPFQSLSVRFAWLRIARIYPAILACMMAFFILSWLFHVVGFHTFPQFTVIQLIQNATLYYPAMHGPSWSVQVEVLAVPFLLAAEWLRRRLGTVGLLVCLLYAMVAIDDPALVFRLPAVWPYLFMFFVGWLVAAARIEGFIRDLPCNTEWLALALFVAGRHVTERASISGLIAQALAGGLLLACLAYRDDRLAWMLTRPVCLLLGRISYSYYLLNVVALYVCWGVIDMAVPVPAEHALSWGFGSALVSVALTIPAAMLSATYIEQWAMAAFRWPVSRQLSLPSHYPRLP